MAVVDDPMASWEIPQGLLYSDTNVRAFVSTVMDAFNPKWFHRGALRPDPLREAWKANNSAYAVITLCRVGRDIWKLRQRQDPQQTAYLAGLIHRSKTADRKQRGMEDYLHELHTAMLFDDAHGALGQLAPPTQDGYDVMVRLSGERTLWISCKRLHRSQGESLFLRSAAELRAIMGSIAERYGHRALDGVVYVESLLNEFPRDRLLDAWAALCQRFDGRSAVQVVEEGFFLRINQSIMLSLPGVDPQTLQSAVAVQFFSTLPDQEHERVRQVIQAAQNQLRASTAPAPSGHDAWIVAVQVPRFVSTAQVAELFKKELEDGHFRDIAGVIVMHTQQAGTVSPTPSYTLSEQIAVIVNLVGNVSLPDFMDGDLLPILVEGYYAPFRPYYQIDDNRFYFDGYVHRDVGPITYQFVGPSLTIALPPIIPEVVLTQDELPAQDTESQVPLSFVLETDV